MNKVAATGRHAAIGPVRSAIPHTVVRFTHIEIHKHAPGSIIDERAQVRMANFLAETFEPSVPVSVNRVCWRSVVQGVASQHARKLRSSTEEVETWGSGCVKPYD